VSSDANVQKAEVPGPKHRHYSAPCYTGNELPLYGVSESST
jgi:hypothetical protein